MGFGMCKGLWVWGCLGVFDFQTKRCSLFGFGSFLFFFLWFWWSLRRVWVWGYRVEGWLRVFEFRMLTRIWVSGF